MRNEDQTARHSQDEEGRIRAPLIPGQTRMIHAVELLGPITLFVSVYVATFLAIGYGASTIGLPLPQWAALIAAICATAFTIRVAEGGRWRLGAFLAPRIAAIDFLRGVFFAAALILVADALVITSSHLRQVRGGAMGITSLTFAALHAGNRGVTALAIANLFLAGVLLALAYERYERLWFPIGINLNWNVLSGPILGFGVSGYVARATLLRTTGTGPAWITGGIFGIEGSVWMGIVEICAIVLLARNAERRMQNAE